MSRFSIKPTALSGSVGTLDSLSTTLLQVSETIRSIGNNLAISGNSQWSIRRSLHVVADGVASQKRACKSLSTGLATVTGLYQKTEGGTQTGWSSTIKAAATGISVGLKSKDSSPLPKAGYKALIAALGPVGLIVDGVKSGVEGKWGSVAGDGFKLVGKVAKNVEGSKINWKGLFGTAASTKSPWEQGVGKFFDFSTKKAGIASACNWAATIISTGFENAEEFSGNLGARFFVETATESALKVGEGVLITAGVAAGAAALTVATGVAFPALAVGAVAAGATVLVDWGLNALTKKLTGGAKDKWYDALGDVIIDSHKATVKWVAEGAKKIGNAVANAGKAVADGLSKVADGVGNALRNWGGSISKWAFGF